MPKYFLIKEHNYEKIDNYFREQDISLILGSYDTYDAAIDVVKNASLQPDDIIYVVEVVAKCYGDAREENSNGQKKGQQEQAESNPIQH